MKPGARPTGHSQRTLRRVVAPAHASAQRLDAAGAARDAKILRELLHSHAGQRAWLQQFAQLPMKARNK